MLRSIFLQALLGLFLFVLNHALLIVAHNFGWFPEDQLAAVLMISIGAFQVETVRWIMLAVVTAIMWGTADYFLYRRHPTKSGGANSSGATSGSERFGHPTITQYSPPVPSGLYTRQWVLVYNPSNPKGRKSISFNEDGTIGEGRNHNEWRWSYTNDHLDIWMKDNRLHNRFKYDPPSGRFHSTNDLEMHGQVRNQVIYQGKV